MWCIWLLNLGYDIYHSGYIRDVCTTSVDGRLERLLHKENNRTESYPGSAEYMNRVEWDGIEGDVPSITLEEIALSPDISYKGISRGH
jgi:hypothetical protein